MRLNLLAEDKTKKETIEYLVEGIQKIIPVHLDLAVIDERYSLKKDNLIKGYTENKFYSVDDLDKDGFDIEPIIYNLRPIVKKFALKKPDEYLLILTHSPFIYFGWGWCHLVGYVQRLNVFTYSGESNRKERIVTVGGDNFPRNNNVKVACHEIGHILLGTTDWKESDKGCTLIQAVHCNNYINGKRCIMNTPEKITEKTLKKIYLGFCQSCINKMQRRKRK